MLNAIKRPLQDFRRSRLRQKEQQLDSRRGIATLGNLTSPIDASAERVQYEPFQYAALAKLDDHLPVGASDVVYDLGCGLGRVVCHFASKPVAGAVGVEYDPELARAAQANVQRMTDRRAPVRILEGDAAAIDCSDATVIFMYNPFGADTMRRVLAALPDRPGLRVAYANPRHAGVFVEFPVLREIARFDAPYNLRRMPVMIWERT